VKEKRKDSEEIDISCLRVGEDGRDLLDPFIHVFIVFTVELGKIRRLDLAPRMFVREGTAGTVSTFSIVAKATAFLVVEACGIASFVSLLLQMRHLDFHVFQAFSEKIGFVVDGRRRRISRGKGKVSALHRRC
jgi:hypothetical protein